MEKISRSRVSRFLSELSNDVSPIERGLVDVEAQGHVNVRDRVHQDCFERRDLHDEMRAEMSLMVISVENATSMDPGETTQQHLGVTLRNGEQSHLNFANPQCSHDV